MKALEQVRFKKRVQTVIKLHQMTVCIMNQAAFGVGHCSVSLNCASGAVYWAAQSILAPEALTTGPQRRTSS